MDGSNYNGRSFITDADAKAAERAELRAALLNTAAFIAVVVAVVVVMGWAGLPLSDPTEFQRLPLID